LDITPYIQNLYQLPPNSHKGQNGKLLIIGGSHLFHAASLWALKIASRVVDMVFYCSVPENNHIIEKCKEEFRDGIIVPRNDLEHYVKEADCILIGPGMMRQEINNSFVGEGLTTLPMGQVERPVPTLKEINDLKNEGEQTFHLTRYLLTHFPNKKFVIDAGALQELCLEWLKNLKETPILSPHHQELEMLTKNNNISTDDLIRRDRPPGLSAIILLKGQTDKIYSPHHKPIEILGGVPGMTKGGSGDVLAGLIASFYCKNNALTSTVTASFFNKKAGEELSKTMGNYFNSSDLVNQLPKTMHRYTATVIPAKAGIQTY
jgi:NAD(P)H-hydrate epimerase